MLEKNDIVINADRLKSIIFDKLLEVFEETENVDEAIEGIVSRLIVYGELMHMLKNYMSY